MKVLGVVSILLVVVIVVAVFVTTKNSERYSGNIPSLPSLLPDKTTLLANEDVDVNGSRPLQGELIETKTHVSTTGIHSVIRNNFVFVDSDLYDPTTGVLPLTFDLRNVVSMELYSISVPSGEFVISELNNSFTMTTGGTDFTIALTIGDYDANELAVHVQAQIRAGTGDATFFCEYIPLTTSYKFTSTSAEFQVVFTDADRLLQYNFGLPEQTNASTNSGGTHTLQGSRIDLFNARYLEISCEEMRKHYSNTNVVGTVDLSQELNYKRGYDEHFVRQFAVPIERWRGIELKLRTKMPYIDLQPYNNRGLGFHLCLCIQTLHRQQDIRQIHDIYQ